MPRHAAKIAEKLASRRRGSGGTTRGGRQVAGRLGRRWVAQCHEHHHRGVRDLFPYAPVSGVADEQPSPTSCVSWRSRTARRWQSGRIHAARHPVGERICTPRLSVSTLRSDVGRSRGHFACRGRSISRRCDAMSSRLPATTPPRQPSRSGARAHDHSMSTSP